MNYSHHVLELPFCDYPTSEDTEAFGQQCLPDQLPEIDWEKVKKYNLPEVSSLALSTLKGKEVLEVAKVIANGFVEKEPTQRYLKAPSRFPESLNSSYYDAFGKTDFGPKTAKNAFYWLIRLVFLTNPYSSEYCVPKNNKLLSFSVTSRDTKDIPQAGILCMPLSTNQKQMREDEFMQSIIGMHLPGLELVFSQEHDALDHLTSNYNAFKTALEEDQVVNLLMLAKTELFSTTQMFALLVKTIKQLKTKGIKYVTASASNQWSGAALEALNASRVHYSPFRNKKRVALTKNATENEVHSKDGYLSDKDSGMMFYIIKL